MTEERWRAVDELLAEKLFPEDQVLDDALRAAAAAGLPSISVSPTEGRLLQLLVRATRARRVLEVGTLGGFSGIWMARGLDPGGTLVTLEVDARHAAVARENFERAGLGAVVDLRLGPALESLTRMRGAGEEPFDLVFIDADKREYPDYLAHSLALSHPGTLIVLDNMVREGRIVDEDSDEWGIQGTRAALDALAAEPRLEATVIQTVGGRGYDGFALALVT
ncbi:MAG: O-methyltransferase [Acidimicrobiales bacterium]